MKTMNFAGMGKIQKKIAQQVDNQMVKCTFHWSLFNEVGVFVMNGSYVQEITRKQFNESRTDHHAATIETATYENCLEIYVDIFHFCIEVPRDYTKCTVKCTW